MSENITNRGAAIGSPLSSGVTSGRLPGLESLRGISALLLVVFHIRYIPTLEAPAFLESIIVRFGSGVPLFYAISAFSLMHGYEKCLDEKGGLAKFFKRRFFRISPLFYFMLFIWLLINKLYFHANIDFRSVFLSVTYSFGMFPGQHEGIVWGSWSVGTEWIFYAIFPLLLTIASTWKSAVALFIISLVISVNTPSLLTGIQTAAPSFSYMCFPNHLVFFSSGILAYRIVYPGNGSGAEWVNNSKAWIPWAIATGSLVWLIIGWKEPGSIYIAQRNLGLQWLAGAWCLLLVGTSTGLPWVLDNNFFRKAGQLSFGLYLTNPPIIFAMSEVGFFRSIYAAFPDKWMAFTLCCAVCIVLVWITAYLTFRFIEKPGIKLGERFINPVN
ncbi:MAG: hypothetical protein RJA20_869 [Bacteroidota bacterium]|jgi:peptidoglycan/LPS O-acetylase OafA/YrhL